MLRYVKAQLFVYQNPARIGILASARGLDFGRQVEVNKRSVGQMVRRAPTKAWAGFVLSGVGREP